jgi:hypothetical protein
MFEQKVKNVTNLDETKRDLLKIHRKSFLTGKNAGGAVCPNLKISEYFRTFMTNCPKITRAMRISHGARGRSGSYIRRKNG